MALLDKMMELWKAILGRRDVTQLQMVQVKGCPLRVEAIRNGCVLQVFSDEGPEGPLHALLALRCQIEAQPNPAVSPEEKLKRCVQYIRSVNVEEIDTPVLIKNILQITG